MLEWIPYTGPETIPTDEPVLMDTASKVYRYNIGTFTKNSSGQVIGVVGGIFHFDTKIIRWARIAHLLPKE